jgi:hypothetical protein
VSCRCSTLNEDKALPGWQETVTTPKFYRCGECADDDSTPDGDGMRTCQ